jgi:RNA polymerase sigma-70 factor (sigma-E family)
VTPESFALEAAIDQPLSFADLYQVEYLPMLRLATLMTGSREVAEDVVHDAFLRVHRSWGRAQKPGAYLRAAVVNACRSWQRRQVLERSRQPRPGPASTDAGGDEMWDALGRLPARQRAALVLRFYEDLSEAEIATLLKCRPGTVKSLVHRGLERLAKEVER